MDLISGSDKDISFKASAGRGVINIIADEGDKKHASKVCLYGELIGVSNADDALCTENVRINIK